MAHIGLVTPAKSNMCYDHRGNENNSNKSVDVLGSVHTGNGCVKSAAMIAAYRLPRTGGTAQ